MDPKDVIKLKARLNEKGDEFDKHVRLLAAHLKNKPKGSKNDDELIKAYESFYSKFETHLKVLETLSGQIHRLTKALPKGEDRQAAMGKIPGVREMLNQYRKSYEDGMRALRTMKDRRN